MNTHHMQQGLKGSIAGVVAAATLLAGGILVKPRLLRTLEGAALFYGKVFRRLTGIANRKGKHIADLYGIR